MAADPPSGAGTLYLVPTPIGNPRDITLRAIDVLSSVAVVAAEDTRKAHTLFQRLEIQPTKLISYHDVNERSRSAEILRLLAAGQDVALITDAGTPLVNDPGYRAVTAAVAEGFRIRALPGPSAVLTALVGSGLACHSFTYGGFLPRKTAARRAAISRLATLPTTLIFFEAPHRLLETVTDLCAVLGDRNAVAGRNLTKADEEYLRGPLSAIAARLSSVGTVRGEYTLVVDGAAERDTTAAADLADQMARSLLARDVPASTVRDVVKEVTGLPRNDVYKRVQAHLAADPKDAGP
jgi:16S rRNA (cytidine1402-2'-O)-methyltransferase